MIKYIVVETYCEYNDNDYDFNEDFYNITSKLYSTREEAEKEMNRLVLNLFYYKGEFKPDSFNFDLYKYIEENSELYCFLISTFKDGNINNNCLASYATVEQCLQAYKLLNMELYRIIEIEETL